jgi:hypothetical protein
MAAVCSPVRLEPQPKLSCLVNFFHVSHKSSRWDYFTSSRRAACRVPS